MPVLFTNNASAPLAASISSSATAITVTTGQGALFPAISGSDYFYATLTNSSNQLEIVKVTARASDNMTVIRGQEGTTARAYSAADTIEVRVTAAGLTNMVQLDGAQTISGAKNFTTAPTFNGGALPIASGGTNSTATATNGGVGYGTGTAHAYTTAGTSGQILSSNGSAAPTWIAQSSIAAGSATNATLATLATTATLATLATTATLATLATQASSALIRSWVATPAGGGTNVTLVGIPSGVKRVTVMLNGVSTNTAGGAGGDIQIQIGAGSISTSGYNMQTAFISGSSALTVSYSSGFVVANLTGAVFAYTGVITLTLVDTNTWMASGNVGTGTSPDVLFMIAGVSPNIGGALDRVRITTAGGTVSFDAGTVNLLYE